VLREPFMLGPASEPVKANCGPIVIFVCIMVAIAGCFWRTYPQRLRTHSELLVAFARKGRDLVATGRFTAENLPELTYPLERAAAFAADVRRRTETPPESLTAFEREIALYRAFVERVDRSRHDRDDSLDAAVAGIERAAHDVDAALGREGR
jgi:hypothetical protein